MEEIALQLKFDLQAKKIAKSWIADKGKAFVFKPGSIWPDRMFKPVYVWARNTFREPTIILHPEDHMKLAVYLHCWDAALDTLREITHHSIEVEFAKLKDDLRIQSICKMNQKIEQRVTDVWMDAAYRAFEKSQYGIQV